MSDIFDRTHPRHMNGAAMSAFQEISELTRTPPCPRCGTPMWLARLEPHPRPTGGADDMIYECGCGEQLIKTVETK